MSRHELARDGAEHAVHLRDAGEGLVEARVVGGGREQSVLLRAQDLGGGRWLLRVGDDVHEAQVERDAAGMLRVRFASGDVELEPLDPFRDAVRKGRTGASGPRKVNAPIPGRVVDVLVAVGDAVTQGQPLVIVEAMKMANEIRAPIAGRVAKLRVQRGEPVDAGATLVVIEG